MLANNREEFWHRKIMLTSISLSNSLLVVLGNMNNSKQMSCLLNQNLKIVIELIEVASVNNPKKKAK